MPETVRTIRRDDDMLLQLAMKRSVHKTQSVFERYNIFDKENIELVMRRQEVFLDSLVAINLSTIDSTEYKKELTCLANPLKSWCLGRDLNSYRDKPRGILSPLRLPVPPPRHF